jgi:hypothetical protein
MSNRQIWLLIAIAGLWVVVQVGNLYMRIKEHNLKVITDLSAVECQSCNDIKSCKSENCV